MTTKTHAPSTNPQAAALAAMTYAEVETVSMVASTVRHDLRKKAASLRSLRAIEAARPLINPYDSRAFRMTAAVWELILTVIGSRIDDTCKALVELEYAADREAQRRDTPAEAPAEGEPAADIYRKSWPEVVEAMKVERAQPCGTKPTARAFLALMIGRDQSRLTPDRDTVCDILKTHLVNCYQHGVLDPHEFTQAEQLATDAECPRDLLEALRTALLRGLDIIEAMQAAL